MLTTPPLHTKQQIHVFNTIQIYHFLASKRKSFIPITTWLYFCRKWLDSQWVQIEDKIQVHIIENPKEKWVLSLFHTHTEKQKSTISNESVGSALARNLAPVHPPLPACMEHTFSPPSCMELQEEKWVPELQGRVAKRMKWKGQRASSACLPFKQSLLHVPQNDVQT